ncbi:transporter family protein [Dyella flagellata]|uniref:hypothetical protein n=1 Tax=Dyella flagellata TaxID=1867833 RepID=UPI003846AE6F
MKCILFASLFASTSCCVQASSSDSDVNFTGPLITPNPMNLPQGTLLIEPYLLYYKSDSVYDSNGNEQPVHPGLRQWQLSLPMFYGITDRFQVQATLGAVHSMSGNMSTDGWKVGDTSVGAQYLLLSPGQDGKRPAVSVFYAHRFPTGNYDQLDENPFNANGNGANIDTLSLRAQQIVWLPNKRPLRVRASLSYNLPPSGVNVNGYSTYGTPKDFHGIARLGQGFGAAIGTEYSINSQWVLALDLTYDRTGSSQLRGVTNGGDKLTLFERRTSSRNVYSLAPAAEYNFNDRFGLIAGVQLSFAGRDNDAFMTPMAAFNMAF